MRWPGFKYAEDGAEDDEEFFSSDESETSGDSYRKSENDGYEEEAQFTHTDEEDSGDSESGNRARQRALKILKARNEMPAAGKFLTLARRFS